MVVSPSTDKVIKGIVTLNLVEVPEGTGVTALLLQGQGAPDTSGPNLGLDTDGSDGWSYILDTTKYDNGVYTVGGIAGISLGGESDQPLGAVSTQVIIEN